MRASYLCVAAATCEGAIPEKTCEGACATSRRATAREVRDPVLPSLFFYPASVNFNQVSKLQSDSKSINNHGQKFILKCF